MNMNGVVYDIKKNGKGNMDNTKEQKIDQLVEWVVGLMDIDDLESYVRDDLKEYYEGIEDIEEFNELYSNAKEVYE